MSKTVQQIIKNWAEVCMKRHDKFCNQRYDGTKPYSSHLKMVAENAENYSFLLKGGTDEYFIAVLAAWGHDLIEDARLTYNDIKELLLKIFRQEVHYKLQEEYLQLLVTQVAEVIYCVTDEKGKTRADRKNDKYYKELKSNELAVYVKLCDILANKTYSKMTKSSMYQKYTKEFPVLKNKLYLKRFDKLFNEIETL